MESEVIIDSALHKPEHSPLFSQIMFLKLLFFAENMLSPPKVLFQMISYNLKF